MVILYCIVFVLLITGTALAASFKIKLKMSLFQSTILGLLMSIPICYMFCLDFLNIVGRGLFSIAAILGGSDINELQSLMLKSMIEDAVNKGSQVGGGFSVHTDQDSGDQEAPEEEYEVEGDRSDEKDQ